MRLPTGVGNTSLITTFFEHLYTLAEIATQPLVDFMYA